MAFNTPNLYTSLSWSLHRCSECLHTSTVGSNPWTQGWFCTIWLSISCGYWLYIGTEKRNVNWILTISTQLKKQWAQRMWRLTWCGWRERRLFTAALLHCQKGGCLEKHRTSAECVVRFDFTPVWSQKTWKSQIHNLQERGGQRKGGGRGGGEEEV